jgi:hypothetical protein
MRMRRTSGHQAPRLTGSSRRVRVQAERPRSKR